MHLPKAYIANWPWVYILCMLVGMSANSISLGQGVPKILLKRTLKNYAKGVYLTTVEIVKVSLFFVAKTKGDKRFKH